MSQLSASLLHTGKGVSLTILLSELGPKGLDGKSSPLFFFWTNLYGPLIAIAVLHRHSKGAPFNSSWRV